MQELEREAIKCPNCGNTWLEQIRAQQLQENHQIALGQDVPVVPDSYHYTVLRCLRCNDLLQPRLSYSSVDLANGKHQHFVDSMEGKLDTRDKQPEMNNLLDRIETLESKSKKTNKSAKNRRKPEDEVQDKG